MNRRPNASRLARAVRPALPARARRASPRAAAEPTRERLLRVAADAWHARSFDGIGTAELCRRARVHKGSFFHFFPSKEALLLAVLERHAERVRTELRSGPFAPDVAPLARFRRFFALTLATARAEQAREGCLRGCPIGNVVNELSTRDGAARDAAARVFDEMRAVFSETVRAAVSAGELPPGSDPDLVAARLLAFLQGLAVLGKAYGDLDALARWGGGLDALLGVPSA